MIHTYKFQNIDKRNQFTAIVKELWFEVRTNTYTETESTTRTHIHKWSWYSNTSNTTKTIYQVDIEKNMNDDEEAKFKKFEKFFFYKKNENSFFKSIAKWSAITLWLFILLNILVWMTSEIFNLWDKLSTLLAESTITYWLLWMWWIYLIITIYQKWEKNEKLDKKRYSDLKEYLLKNYLWNTGKKIVEKI